MDGSLNCERLLVCCMRMTGIAVFHSQLGMLEMVWSVVGGMTGCSGACCISACWLMAVLLVVGLDTLSCLVWSRSGMGCCVGLDTVFISTVTADSLLLLTSPQSYYCCVSMKIQSIQVSCQQFISQKSAWQRRCLNFLNWLSFYSSTVHNLDKFLIWLDRKVVTTTPAWSMFP